MDIAFEAVGSQGKYQKIIAYLVILVAPLALIMGSSFPFLTKKPEFYCKEKESLENFHLCSPKDLCKNDFFDYKKIPSQSLNNWAYDYDLYCTKSYLSPVLGTTFFCGGIIGCILFSHIPDQHGRKEIYNILLITMFVLHVNIFLAINEWHILFINILLGMTSYAYAMAPLIITEYIDRSTAGIIMSLNNAVFPFSGILIALFFVYINNWRFLFFICSALSLVSVLISKKYFLESPRWLNSKNKFVETLAVLKEMAKINDNEENFNKFISVNKSKNIKYKYNKRIFLN